MEEKLIQNWFDWMYRHSYNHIELAQKIEDGVKEIKDILEARFNIVKNRMTPEELYRELKPIGFSRTPYSHLGFRKEEGQISWTVYMTPRANFTLDVYVDAKGSKSRTYKKISSLLRGIETLPFEIIALG